MALLVLFGVLIVFDIAAWFLGVDSREWGTGRSDRPARSI
jgi:hypothetical protein